MRSVLAAVAVVSTLVLPLAAHADTFSLNDPSGLVVITPEVGEDVSLQSWATNQALSDQTAIVILFSSPDSFGDGATAALDFELTVDTAFGTETITEDGINTFATTNPDAIPTFSSTSTTLGGPAVYNVAFSSSLNTSTSTETIDADFTANPNFAPSAVTPEPGSVVLLGTGLLGVAGAARRRLFQP
jgi:PEP-CTERM motif